MNVNVDNLSIQESNESVVVDNLSDETIISPLMVGGETYYGVIPATYLDYFEGIVNNISILDNYVAWRAGEYDYRLFIGDIDYDSSSKLFTADNGTCITIKRDGESYGYYYYVYEVEDSLNLDATGLFVYSDLGNYASLVKGGSAFESTALLFTVVLMFLFSVITNIYKSLIS